MEDYKKDIILVYHIPVDGLSRQQAEQQIYDIMKTWTIGDFYKELFIPKINSGGKVDIEVINLKGNKIEHIELNLEKLDDSLMKYFEHDKWLRKNKLNRIVNEM